MTFISPHTPANSSLWAPLPSPV